MASEVRIGKLRYDIISDTTKFEKGIKATRAEIKMADKAFRDHAKASDITRQKLERLASVERKAGASGAAIAHQRKMLQAQLQQELSLEAQLEAAKKKAIRTGNRKSAVVLAESESVKKLNKQLLALEKTEEKRSRFNARGGAIGGTLGGNIFSMMGLGGVGGAAGRFAGTGIGGFMAPGVGSTLGITGGLLTTGVGLKAIASWGKLEREIVDFSAIVGDPGKADSLVSSFRRLAKETPLTTGVIIRNAKVLRGYGVDLKNETDFIRRIGDVAGGSAEKMTGLTLAIGQIAATGYLTGQDRLQLINNGFGMKPIADAAGVEMANLKDAIENRQITWDHVKQAVINTTNEGGLFADRMKKASMTISGSWDRMFAEITEGFENLGEKMSKDGVIASSMRGFGATVNEILTIAGEGLDEIRGKLKGFKDMRNDVVNSTVGPQMKALTEFIVLAGSKIGAGTILDAIYGGPEYGGLHGGRKKPPVADPEAFRRAMGLGGDSGAAGSQDAPAKPTPEEIAGMQAEADANRASAAAMKDQIEFQIRLLKYNDRQKHQATVVRELNQLRKEGKITEMEYNEIYRKRMELYDAQQAMNDQEKQQDEEKSKRIEAIKEQERQQVEALRKRAEAERKALGNTRVTLGGVGGSSAGADYQFLSNRAKSQEQFRLDEERNKKLAEISDRLKGDIDKAGKEADAKIEIIKMGD